VRLRRLTEHLARELLAMPRHAWPLHARAREVPLVAARRGGMAPCQPVVRPP